MENSLYFYLSKLIVEYFIVGTIRNGDRYQIYFEENENVSSLYSCLKTFVNTVYADELSLIDFHFNNYTTYCIQFKDFNLIVASHSNSDLLTGLRNNFYKQSGFSSNSAILFVHNTELESIVKGAQSLSNKDMPLHVDSVRSNIIATFSQDDDNTFTKTQKQFLSLLLLSDDNDYLVESKSVFDLKKYLDILNNKQLSKSDYNGLGVFYDHEIQTSSVSSAQIKERLKRNVIWFRNISQCNQIGSWSLEKYLSKCFDKEGQRLLKDPDNWPFVSYEDLLKFEANKDAINFNEYIPNISEITFFDDVIWDKADGNSKIKKQSRNILLFNSLQLDEITLNLKFKRKPTLTYLSEGRYSAVVDQTGKGINIALEIKKPVQFNHFLIHYNDKKDEQINRFTFKVLVVPFESSLFLAIKSLYTVDSKSCTLKLCSDSDIVFNDQGLITDPVLLQPNMLVDINRKYQLVLNSLAPDLADSHELPFAISFQGAILNAKLTIDLNKPQPLSGWGLWRKKNFSNVSGYFTNSLDEKSRKRTITIEHGSQIYYPVSELRTSLLLEHDLISLGHPINKLLENGQLEGDDLGLPEDIKIIYQEIIQYYRSRQRGKFKLLPSTAFLDAELLVLYGRYLKIYLRLIENTKLNDVVLPEHIALLRLGSIQEVSGLARLRFSPLHPLIVAYQLKLKECLTGAFLPEKIYSKFTPLNLVPFINDGSGEKEYYIGIDQDHSPEWLYFVSARVEGQSINRKNAPEIISKKISDFVENFSFLFLDSDSPIKLNLVNVGNGLEALQGVFRYIITAIRDKISSQKSLLEIHPILINIYGGSNYTSKFEQFSMFENVDEILHIFEIDLKTLRNFIEPLDLLKLYHDKVKFFIKNDFDVDDEVDYAHISFHQFSEGDIEKSDNNTNEVSTGISLNGIMSDLPSIFNHGNYRSGFGTRSLFFDADNVLLNISLKLNSIAHVSGTSNIFKDDIAFGSVINDRVRDKLLKVYNSAQWVTFINPMVDLSFFKNDKDLVIIHYVDQYANASGYDSITITTKWKQYEYILNEFLKTYIDDTVGHIKPIINMFNAINGYWLLKLGSQYLDRSVEKEKISILSAVKNLFAILDHPNITWVVLSLEEILRVTGSAGLSQSQGLFTVKNLDRSGAFSDDLLMVGIEDLNGELVVNFYPVEIKVGNNSSKAISKGVGQGANTFTLLNETLGQAGLAGKIYRNYFGKLILAAAQKLSLYEVWPSYSFKWDQIELYRGRLLNDDFSLGSLSEYIGNFAVLSFKNNEYKNRGIILTEDDISYSIINLYESDGLNDLIHSIEKLKDRYNAELSVGITSNDLLCNKYLHIASKIPVVGIVEDPFETFNISDKINDSSFVDLTSRDPLKVTFGYNVMNHEKVEWFPTSSDKVMHFNTGIIGTMGTGKTQFTKSLITQLLNNSFQNVGGKKIGILIFDYKGDYIKKDFIEQTDAKVYELHNLPYNPLALFLDNNPRRLLPLHTASTLQDTISRAFNLGNRQKATLEALILEAYANVGIFKGDDTTWGNIAPTIADVCALYLEKEDSNLDSLHAVLKKLSDFEIFESQGSKAVGLFDLLDGVTVINLTGNNSEIQNLVVAITLDLFYSQMQNQGHSIMEGQFRQINKIILVDEADNFLYKDFQSLRKILKEGREYGVGTILSTQFLNHFTTGDNEYSNYIITWIIHRVSEIKEKEIGSLFSLSSRSDREALINVIKSLPKHQSIVNLAGSLPIHIRDLPFWELIQGI